MLTIGEFSKISHLTLKTLRYYDEIGLLKPVFIDARNGFIDRTLKKLFIFVRRNQGYFS
ncbi:MerR family DNA-binding transcriptional regulator [Lysinibacillus sp. NPDC092081]|uniref:MerR family DNA-binding transcriptional regulator n=1 Tax=Lysinibacillus sp. NPDC092081 TaxID=3364131 RepID=UPI0037FCF76C